MSSKDYQWFFQHFLLGFYSGLLRKFHPIFSQIFSQDCFRSSFAFCWSSSTWSSSRIFQGFLMRVFKNFSFSFSNNYFFYLGFLQNVLFRYHQVNLVNLDNILIKNKPLLTPLIAFYLECSSIPCRENKYQDWGRRFTFCYTR